jgi:hypothetical protein
LDIDTTLHIITSGHKDKKNMRKQQTNIAYPTSITAQREHFHSKNENTNTPPEFDN